jgi:nucleoside-diphosphate-sugar epimerase
MVIGNGMIAKRFETYKDNNQFVIFASGVSNSKSTNDDDYNRETELLQTTITNNKEKTFIYFSTCNIYDPSENKSMYVLHKKKIEKYIINNQSSYYIFRVSNAVGKSKNRNTILNFFVYHILNKINFDLWYNATRNLIDMDDIYQIVHFIILGNLFTNQVINIANPSNYKVKDIVAAIENFWKIKANYSKIKKGCSFEIDISLIEPIIQKIPIHFGEDYLCRLLQKNYDLK